MALETAFKSLRGDVQDLEHEDEHKRKRLHDLENTTRGLLALRQEERDLVNKQQAQFQRRIQVLTVVVAAAALAEPFLYKLAGQ